MVDIDTIIVGTRIISLVGITATAAGLMAELYNSTAAGLAQSVARGNDYCRGIMPLIIASARIKTRDARRIWKVATDLKNENISYGVASPILDEFCAKYPFLDKVFYKYSPKTESP